MHIFIGVCLCNVMVAVQYMIRSKKKKKKIETDEKKIFYCCKKNVGITRKCFPNDTLF